MEVRPGSRTSQRSTASRSSRASHTSRLSHRSRASRRSGESQTLRAYPSTTPSTTNGPTSSSVFSYYHEYLKAVIGIAVLGGQITFTLIVSDIADPARLNTNSDVPPSKPVFQRETVRLLIALSWLCFTLSLGLGVFALLESNHRITRGNALPPVTSFFYYWIDGVIQVLNVLPMVAFLLLALAVAAYVPIVGWVAVGSIVLYAVAIHLYWLVDGLRKGERGSEVEVVEAS